MNEQQMADLEMSWEARKALRNQAVLDSKTDFISDNAFLCWSKGDLRYFLVERPGYKELEEIRKIPELAFAARILGSMGRYNGYVRFPRLPLVAPGFKGIVSYVPVHGGITFFQEWWDGSVTYGFDTAHIISEQMPEVVNDTGWLMAETESMGRGIQIVARFEPYYLRAGDDNERKARVLDRMGEFLPVEVLGNMGVMLNLLSGEL